MKKNELITPEGTRDLLFNECMARREVENKLSRLFKGFGYSEVVTPGIEFYDLFRGNTRYFSQEMMYKLTDSKGRLITLRPDSTIPIARLVSTRLKEGSLPLRLFYNQPVYVNNALLKGRSDEIAQAGIELIGGQDTEKADYEALCLAVNSLASFDNKNFRLEIGDIGYFKELVERLDVDDNIKEEIRLQIYEKNYPALNDLLYEVGDNDITQALKQLPRLFGGLEVFEKAEKLYMDEKISEILKHLKDVYLKLLSLGYNDNISVDLGIVSHTDYYTGIVFKGYLSGIGHSVLTGGRYDGLLAEFNNPCPAVGFVVNCDDVAKYLIRNMLEPNIFIANCIVYGEKDYIVEAISYAEKLVRSGVTVEISLDKSLSDTKKYAKNKGIKTIYVVSEDINKIEL